MKDTNDGISRKMLGEENSVNKEEWDVFWCKEQGCNYYHNPVTLEVRWDNPNKPKVKFVDDDGIDDSVIAPIVDYSGEKTIKHKNRRSSTGKAKDKQDVVAAEIKDEHLHTTDSNNNNEENSKNLNKDHGTSSKNEWKTHYSKYNDCDFYENTITGEVVWDIPDGLKEDTSNNNDSAVSHKDQDDFSPMKDFTKQKRSIHKNNGGIGGDGDNGGNDTPNNNITGAELAGRRKQMLKQKRSRQKKIRRCSFVVALITLIVFFFFFLWSFSRKMKNVTFYHEWINKAKSFKDHIANNNILKEETVSDYQTTNSRVSMTQLNVKNKVNDNSKGENYGWSKNKDENEGESEGNNDNGKENKIDFARETETEESESFKEGDTKKDNIDNVIVKASTTKDDVKSEKILDPEPSIDQIDGNNKHDGSIKTSSYVHCTVLDTQKKIDAITLDVDSTLIELSLGVDSHQKSLLQDLKQLEKQMVKLEDDILHNLEQKVVQSKIILHSIEFEQTKNEKKELDQPFKNLGNVPISIETIESFTDPLTKPNINWKAKKEYNEIQNLPPFTVREGKEKIEKKMRIIINNLDKYNQDADDRIHSHKMAHLKDDEYNLLLKVNFETNIKNYLLPTAAKKKIDISDAIEKSIDTVSNNIISDEINSEIDQDTAPAQFKERTNNSLKKVDTSHIFTDILFDALHCLENTIEDGVEITNSNKLEISDDNDGKLKIISIDPQNDVKEYDIKEHSDGIEQLLDDEDLKFDTPNTLAHESSANDRNVKIDVTENHSEKSQSIRTTYFYTSVSKLDVNVASSGILQDLNVKKEQYIINSGLILNEGEKGTRYSQTKNLATIWDKTDYINRNSKSKPQQKTKVEHINLPIESKDENRDDDLLSIKKKDQVNQLNAMGKIKRKLCYLSKKCREKHNLIATKK